MAMLDTPNFALPDYPVPGGPAGPLPFEADMAAAAREAAAARLRRAAGKRGFDIPDDPADAPLSSILNAQAPQDAPVPPVAAPPVGLTSPAAAAPAPQPQAPAAPPAAPSQPSWLGMLDVNNPNAGPAGWRAAGAPGIPATVNVPPAAPSPPVKLPDSVPETSLAGRIGDVFSKIHDWTNDHRSTLMALGAGMAGSQNIGQGLSRGGALAIPAQQADLKLAQQNQTVAALQRRGIPPDVAMAAAGNPAIMQQLIGQVFGPKAYQHVMVKDATGREIPLSYDPAKGKYYDASGQPYGGASATQSSDLHGEEFLKTQDPGVRDDIRAMAEGRLPSAGFGAQKTLLPLVAQYDPNFDATQYPTMLATRKNYTSGKQFQEVQAINTVAGHLGNIMRSADALDNTSFPILNNIRNVVRTNTGDPKVDTFNTDKQAVTNELSKAYRGGHVTEGDVNHWQSNINAAKSPEQLKSVIGELNDLLSSKRQALEDGYRSSMGAAPLPKEFTAESAHARDAFNRVSDWAHGVKTEKPAAAAPASAPAASAPAFTPKPGASYRYDPSTGHMIEVK